MIPVMLEIDDIPLRTSDPGMILHHSYCSGNTSPSEKEVDHHHITCAELASFSVFKPSSSYPDNLFGYLQPHGVIARLPKEFVGATFDEKHRQLLES